MGTALLRVREGYTPLEVELTDVIVIGRSSQADLRIAELTVSRKHATVERRAGSFVLTDLGSGNGTFVNSQKVRAPVVLNDGDQVRFGDVVMEFLHGGEPSEATTDDGVTLDELAESSVLDRVEASSDLSVSGDESHVRRRLKLLYDVSRDIGQTFDEDEILEAVVEKLFEVFPQADTAAAVLYDREHDVLTPKSTRRRAGDKEVRISRSLVREVIQTRSGVMTADAKGDASMQAFHTLQSLNVQAVLCVPMISGEEAYGVLQLAAADSRIPFQREDMLLLLGVAGQTALALSSARMHRRMLQQELLDKDLALATKIQQSFLPDRLPEAAGYGFERRYRPALQVGGDYYSFLDLGDGVVALSLGDVSGKGISAALYMARLSSEMRYQAADTADPGVVLERLNDILSDDASDGMFVTLELCTIDTKTHRVRVANAGHHPPAVCSLDGTVTHLDVPRNQPLGVVAGVEFLEAEFELDPGDSLMLYTDGVNEAEGVGSEQFGEERLERAMRESDRTPAGIAETIFDRVLVHLGDRPQNDDITLLTFGRLRG